MPPRKLSSPLRPPPGNTPFAKLRALTFNVLFESHPGKATMGDISAMAWLAQRIASDAIEAGVITSTQSIAEAKRASTYDERAENLWWDAVERGRP